MYTSRQCTYTHANQVWGNGQWFQRANDDTTGTNFSSGKPQWWRTLVPLLMRMTRTPTFPGANNNEETHFVCVALLMVTKMRTSSTVNTRTTYQWKQVDSVCTHTASKFEATDNSNKQMTIQISKSSYEQTKVKRATCFRSLDGIKDADKFNS